jgi:hypothetical protein
MIKLGINIDHVATLRQARGTKYPSVVEAALRAEQAGADSITLHLREDRRHMQDEDIFAIRPLLQTKMNLELAATDVAIIAPQLPLQRHHCHPGGMLFICIPNTQQSNKGQGRTTTTTTKTTNTNTTRTMRTRDKDKGRGQ